MRKFKRIASIALIMSMVLSTGLTAFAAELDCTHSHTEMTEAIEPDCVNYGHTEGEFCNDCHTYVSGHQKIDPIGHIDEDGDEVCDDCEEHFTTKDAVEATCTTGGYTGDKELANGRIQIGKNIPASGHVDTNKDYICDICGDNIDKKDITLTLHYYVTKEDYEENKEKYAKVKVKEDCDIESCVYVTAKINVKQAIDAVLPDYPSLARYDFQWIDRKNNIYSTFRFHKDTDLYMAYSESGVDRPYGQAGNDVYWMYYPEEKLIYFYGRGPVWSDYETRTELPWYEYLMKAEKTQIGGSVTAKAWTIITTKTLAK